MTDTEQLLERVHLIRALPSPAMRRAIRLAAGVSQREVAAAVGVSRASVAHYEAGSKSPRGENLRRYVEILHALRGVS